MLREWKSLAGVKLNQFVGGFEWDRNETLNRAAVAAELRTTPPRFAAGGGSA